jgi:hypothetical protein
MYEIFFIYILRVLYKIIEFFIVCSEFTRLKNTIVTWYKRMHLLYGSPPLFTVHNFVIHTNSYIILSHAFVKQSALLPARGGQIYKISINAGKY